MWAYIISQLPKDQYPGETNEEVVLHYQRGECVFDQVLNRYYKMITRLALKYTIKGMDSDDMFQEYLIKLSKCCKSWNKEEDIAFSTYVSTACQNHWKYLLRKAKTDANRIHLEDINSLDETEDDGEGGRRPKYEPSVNLETPAELLLLNIPLTPTEQEYVCLILEGYSNKEISDKKQVSRTWVSNVLRGLGRKLIRLGMDIRG